MIGIVVIMLILFSSQMGITGYLFEDIEIAGVSVIKS